MDYYRILNLNSEPFSNSPDPDFFFQSVQHVECLQKLEISLRLRRGLNVVIGDVGAGKTTLSRLLIRRFADEGSVDVHLIMDPHFKSSTDFLTTVKEILDGVYHVTAKEDLKLKETIKNTLYTKGVDENRTVILIIDEGQKLPLDCLEILREFLNYETNKFKLLQIVIFAQREFEDTISKLENFRDRINFYHELGSLNYKETRGLVEYRLKQASRSSETRTFFSITGLMAIYLATGGFPRKIINLCHRSLLAMIIQNKGKANWMLVLTCMDKEGTKRLLSKLLLPALGGVILLAGIGISGLYTMDFFQKSGIPVAQVQTEAPKPVNEKSPADVPIQAMPVPPMEDTVASLPEQTTPLIEEKPDPTHVDMPEAEPLPDNQGIIVEQDIREEADHRPIEKNKPISIATREPDSLEASSRQRLRVLSGPGASIEVRRLIPEKR